MRFFKITVPNVVGYLKLFVLTVSDRTVVLKTVIRAVPNVFVGGLRGLSLNGSPEKSGFGFQLVKYVLEVSQALSPAPPQCGGLLVIYSQFSLAIHQNDHQARRRFVEWTQNEIAVVPDFHKRILFSDEAHFWLNGYVNKQNFRIWSEANPQVYVETPLHPEKLTVGCALWAGGILLQKR
ncbi:uncharacterized protein TNCV_1757831 [Trichonephila clavipes]|nr:uncharacterized protein TNCV_1757831 [Trichonephila clavipes]